MKNEEIIYLMVNEFNSCNIVLAKQANMSEEEIKENIDRATPSITYAMGFVFEKLKNFFQGKGWYSTSEWYRKLLNGEVKLEEIKQQNELNEIRKDFIRTKAKSLENILDNLEDGDGVIYRGCDLDHWREVCDAPPDWRMGQVFMHYVDQNGPYTEHKYDKRYAKAKMFESDL